MGSLGDKKVPSSLHYLKHSGASQTWSVNLLSKGTRLGITANLQQLKRSWTLPKAESVTKKSSSLCKVPPNDLIFEFWFFENLTVEPLIFFANSYRLRRLVTNGALFFCTVLDIPCIAWQPLHLGDHLVPLPVEGK